jgi:ssRNA-specific RNase YbeY (16S rRNA maturation enzyme)
VAAAAHVAAALVAAAPHAAALIAAAAPHAAALIAAAVLHEVLHLQAYEHQASQQVVVAVVNSLCYVS